MDQPGKLGTPKTTMKMAVRANGSDIGERGGQLTGDDVQHVPHAEPAPDAVLGQCAELHPTSCVSVITVLTRLNLNTLGQNYLIGAGFTRTQHVRVIQ